MLQECRFTIFDLLKEILQFIRSNKRLCIIHYSIFIAFGCGGIRLPQTFFSFDKDVIREELVPPLEKIFEHTTVAGFPKDAGTLVDSFLFVGTFNGEIKVYNIVTGKSHGYIDVGTSVASAPIVDSERIYVALSKDKYSFVCYNIAERKIEWKKEIGEIETQPLLFNSSISVINSNGELCSFRKISGELRWKYNVPSRKRGDSFHSPLATDGENIYFGCDDGFVYSVRNEDGTLRWKLPLEGSIFSSPRIDGDKIFITTLKGFAYSVHKENANILWSYDVQSPLYSSANVNETFVFVTTLGGTVYSLNKESGSVIWKYDAGGGMNVTPHLRGDILYVGTLTKSLLAIEANTGKQVWKFSLEGRLKTNVISNNHFLVAFVEDRTVLAFRSQEKVFEETK